MYEINSLSHKREESHYYLFWYSEEAFSKIVLTSSQTTSTGQRCENTYGEVLYSYQMYFVYLLECKDGSLYTGITTDVDRRFVDHKNGVGGSYTRSKGVKNVVYTEKHPDRSSASKREAEIKSWRREKKLRLIGASDHRLRRIIVA